MTTNICPFTNEEMRQIEMLQISNHNRHCVNPKIFKEWIHFLNLGIDIDLATEEEWIMTAMSDTLPNSNVLRLRNPFTNNPFSEEDLKHIYHEYKTTFQYI